MGVIIWSQTYKNYALGLVPHSPVDVWDYIDSERLHVILVPRNPLFACGTNPRASIINVWDYIDSVKLQQVYLVPQNPLLMSGTR